MIIIFYQLSHRSIFAILNQKIEKYNFIYRINFVIQVSSFHSTFYKTNVSYVSDIDQVRGLSVLERLAPGFHVTLLEGLHKTREKVIHKQTGRCKRLKFYLHTPTCLSDSFWSQAGGAVLETTSKIVLLA